MSEPTDVQALTKRQVELVDHYVTDHGADHEDDCPGDDTCSCSYRPRNAAVNQACRYLAALASRPSGTLAEASEMSAHLYELCRANAHAPGMIELTWSHVMQIARLLAASRPSGEDGSVYVRVDPVYVEQMRGEGLRGNFSHVRLVEDCGEPRLELTSQPTPTPNTVEWWRAVAHELATEIHRLKGIAQEPTR